MNSDEPEDLEKSLNAFKKCANIDMCFSIAHGLGCDKEQLDDLTRDLVEVLCVASRFKEAGNLLCKLDEYELS